MKKNPYEIIKHLRVTEKSVVLENLKNNSSNPSVSGFKLPKYVFDVCPSATKTEIKNAVEEIYADSKVKVTKVNTINVKPKPRRVRGRAGFQPAFKKAVVTLSEGDSLET